MATVPMEILAALVQVPMSTEENKNVEEEKFSPQHTEDFNASQKLLESLEFDNELLTESSNQDDLL